MQNLELNFSQAAAARHCYSVSEISKSIKSVMEDNFSAVDVKGEISGMKSAGSGHVYFNLKDSGAVLRAICWRGVVSQLDFIMQDGLEVVASGKISIYEGQSNYQMIVQKISIAGQGSLLAMLQKRKEALMKEGLFDSARKKPIPFMPMCIGVITAATGSVIRDILHRISDRMGVKVLLWSVLVQGADSAEQVSNAIIGFNNLPENIPKPDLLIVARGGGSIEDLWAFNEEIVVRATASSAIPIISAIGHETDTTLIDYASDKRAPTPTAAAEMAVPVKADLLSNLDVQKQRLKSALFGLLSRKEAILLKYSEALLNFSQKISDMDSRVRICNMRLQNAINDVINTKAGKLIKSAAGISASNLLRYIQHNYVLLEHRGSVMNSLIAQFMGRKADLISNLSRILETCSHQNILEKGFAIITSDQGALVREVAEIMVGMEVDITMKDGSKKAVAL